MGWEQGSSGYPFSEVKRPGLSGSVGKATFGATPDYDHIRFTVYAPDGSAYEGRVPLTQIRPPQETP